MCYSSDYFFSLSFIVIIETILIYNYVSFKTFHAQILLYYPLLILVNAFLFTKNFIDLGDGKALLAVYNNLNGDLSEEIHRNVSFLLIFKNMNAGFFPGIIIAKLISISDCSIKLYISQNFIYFLVTYTIYRSIINMDGVDKGKIDLIFIFSLISPYMLLIGSYPSKYLILFSALFLSINLYYLYNYYNNAKFLFSFLTSLIFVLLLKYQVFFFMILFIAFDQLLYRKNRAIIYAFAPVLLYFYYDYGFFSERINFYLSISNDDGGRKFEFLHQFILTKFLYKFFADTFVVVPWTIKNLFYSDVSTGNNFIVALQIMTSFVVLFQFANFFRNIRSFLMLGSEHSKFLSFFCLFMTMSIYFGKTGFSEYLVIYLPFLTFKYDKYIYIDVLLSLLIIISINFSYYLL